MNYYPIQNDAVTLNPLFMEDAGEQLLCLCNNKGFTHNSMIYTNEFNFSDSTHRLITCTEFESYWFYNRLFIILDKQTPGPRGITGLKDIDWIRRRGELIFIMDQDAIKSKLSYEPLKLLLVNIFKEWFIRRIWVKVLCTDSRTITVLKGFGFSEEGLLRKELLIDGEYIDIKIMGLIKEEFHYNG